MNSWHSTLALSWRVGRSTLFNSKQYKVQNADIGRFPALLHWSRFYQVENRPYDASALSAWLIPAIVTRKISPCNARYLKKISSDILHLEKYANALGLNINDYYYFKAISDGEFTKAYSYLAFTSKETTFDGIYTFATRHMKMSRLGEACEWAQSREKLTLKQAVKAHEMARAIDKNVTKSAQQVLKVLKTYSGKHKAQVQFFVAHLPVIDTGSKVCKALTDATLQAVNIDAPECFGTFAQAVGPLAELINIATYNTLFSPPLALNTDTGEIITLKKSMIRKNKSLKIRVLSPHYWVNTQTKNSVEHSILRFHKKKILEALDDKVLVCPIIASQIFDITHEKNWGLDTLSYHTITHGNMSEGYTHYKESYLSGYFSSDNQGYSGWSSLANLSPEHFSENNQKTSTFHQTLKNKYVDKRVSKYSQIPQAGASFGSDALPNAPYFFAALQVPDDTVAYWQHMPTAKWLKYLCDYAQHLNIAVVIKAHPMDKSLATKALLRTFKHLAHVQVTTASIHELLAGSLAVVTTNSGVGFEALLYHKPVITCGRSDYHVVTMEVKNKTELLEALKKISTKTHALTSMKINEFLYIYCHHHCVYMSEL